MNISEKIGPHTFEMRMTGMGSIDPWFMDILDRYNISAIGTSDIRTYIRYDGKIYGTIRSDYEIHELIDLWKSMYCENKETVEKDIQEWIEKYCDTKFGGYTLDDIFKKWGIEIVKQLEYIRINDNIYHISKKTFKNMCQLFGEMVNRRCYLPKDELDIDGSEDYMTMDISVGGEFNVRLEVVDDGFIYTKVNPDKSIFYSGLKELNKNNISEFIEIIKKPQVSFKEWACIKK